MAPYQCGGQRNNLQEFSSLLPPFGFQGVSSLRSLSLSQEPLPPEPSGQLSPKPHLLVFIILFFETDVYRMRMVERDLLLYLELTP